MADARVAVVTGAASGIGRATARRLAGEGLRLALIDRDADGLASLAAEVSNLSLPLVADVTNAADIGAAVATIAAEFGRIDVLVNCAGGGVGAPLEAMTDADWYAMLELNLTAAFRLTRLVAPVMRRGGGSAIVNVASLAARFASPKGGAAYAAAKAGLVALSRQSAAELASARIRVNTVLPGPTRSALTATSQRVDSDFPLGRWVDADDVAAAIVFLASDAAAMCIGAELVVDGGLSLRLGSE